MNHIGTQNSSVFNISFSFSFYFSYGFFEREKLNNRPI